jgi:hypothetical protein
MPSSTDNTTDNMNPLRDWSTSMEAKRRTPPVEPPRVHVTWRWGSAARMGPRFKSTHTQVGIRKSVFPMNNPQADRGYPHHDVRSGSSPSDAAASSSSARRLTRRLNSPFLSTIATKGAAVRRTARVRCARGASRARSVQGVKASGDTSSSNSSRVTQVARSRLLALKSVHVPLSDDDGCTDTDCPPGSDGDAGSGDAAAMTPDQSICS